MRCQLTDQLPGSSRYAEDNASFIVEGMLYNLHLAQMISLALDSKHELTFPLPVDYKPSSNSVQ